MAFFMVLPSIIGGPQELGGQWSADMKSAARSPAGCEEEKKENGTTLSKGPTDQHKPISKLASLGLDREFIASATKGHRRA